MLIWDSPPKCAEYSPSDGHFFSLDCQKSTQADIVCQFDKQNTHSRNEGKVDLVSWVSTDLDDTIWNVSIVQCHSGHVTRDFLSCDTQDQYGLQECLTSCESGIATIAMFVCEHSHEALHYTLVSDHISHCENNTDEVFCLYRPCPVSLFRCQNGQCGAKRQVCGLGLLRRFGWSVWDRKTNSGIDHSATSSASRGRHRATILLLDGFRWMSFDPRPVLPRFCLPIYLRCIGVDDCPYREDEISCETYICSGFYRCRGLKRASMMTTCVTACSSVLSMMTSNCVKSWSVPMCVNVRVWPLSILLTSQLAPTLIFATWTPVVLAWHPVTCLTTTFWYIFVCRTARLKHSRFWCFLIWGIWIYVETD